MRAINATRSCCEAVHVSPRYFAVAGAHHWLVCWRRSSPSPDCVLQQTSRQPPDPTAATGRCPCARQCCGAPRRCQLAACHCLTPFALPTLPTRALPCALDCHAVSFTIFPCPCGFYLHNPLVWSSSRCQHLSKTARASDRCTGRPRARGRSGGSWLTSSAPSSLERQETRDVDRPK